MLKNKIHRDYMGYVQFDQAQDLWDYLAIREFMRLICIWNKYFLLKMVLTLKILII